MMFLRFAIAFSASCALAMAVQADGDLPAWKEGERAKLEKNGWFAGSEILVGELAANTKPKQVVELPSIPKPKAEEIPENAKPLNQIPEKYWSEYFSKRPKNFLLDPQGILSRIDYHDRLGFLNYHAGDSSVDLFVYVFKGDQEIPGEVRAEEIIERLFSEGRPAVVVFYFMGAPERSTMYLSHKLTEVVPVADQRRALESSVMQSIKEVDPAHQIDKFLVQMSIRIYWMERMMNGGVEPSDAAATPKKAVVPEKKSSLLVKLQPIIDQAKSFIMPAASIAAVLCVALVLVVWLKCRARYFFPETHVEPRLGGPHAAGVGAVISFASAAVPPASQKDQLPEYLRRF